MKHKQSQIEPRGVRPPTYLTEYVLAELDLLGDAELARRIGITRTPLLRLAARLTVHRGTIAAVELHYRARHAA